MANTKGLQGKKHYLSLNHAREANQVFLKIFDEKRR
jgi:hypothetical protein